MRSHVQLLQSNLCTFAQYYTLSQADTTKTEKTKKLSCCRETKKSVESGALEAFCAFICVL